MIDRATFEAESRHLEHDDDPLEDRPDALFSWRRDLPFVLVLMLVWGGLTAFTQFTSVQLTEGDGWYHAAVAEKMVQHGVMLQTFPWLTQVNGINAYFDTAWLFHVALAINLLFGSTLGPKLLLVLINSLIPVGAWYTARHLGIRKPLAWLVLLPFCTLSVFWVRQQQLEPHVLGLLLLTVCLGAILRRRKRILAAASFFFALSSTDYWQVLPLALVGDLIWSNFDDRGRPRNATWEFPMLGTAFLAAVVGSVMHPNFPQSITSRYYLNAMEVLSYFESDSPLAMFRAGSPIALSRGELLLGICPLLICLAAAFVHALRRRNRLPRPVLLFGIASLGYLVVTLVAPRFITYMQPVALLFLVAYLDHRRGSSRVPPRPGLRLAGIAALVVVALASFALSISTRRVPPLQPPEEVPFGAAAAWLRGNLEPGEAVFHTRWQDAAPLFYTAPQLRYLVALDAYSMYAYDAIAFERWYQIRQGHSQDPVTEIHRQFASRVVFTYAPHEGPPQATELQDADLQSPSYQPAALYEQLRSDPRAQLVYGPGPHNEVIFLLDLPAVVPPADTMMPRLSTDTHTPPVLDPSLNPDAPTSPAELDPHYRPIYEEPLRTPDAAPSAPSAEPLLDSPRIPLPMTGEELDEQQRFRNEIRERLGTQPDSSKPLDLLKEMGISREEPTPADTGDSASSAESPKTPAPEPTLTPSEKRRLEEIREQLRREFESPTTTP